jgi:hypothetical protein
MVAVVVAGSPVVALGLRRADMNSFAETCRRHCGMTEARQGDYEGRIAGSGRIAMR